MFHCRFIVLKISLLNTLIHSISRYENGQLYLQCFDNRTVQHVIHSVPLPRSPDLAIVQVNLSWSCDNFYWLFILLQTSLFSVSSSQYQRAITFHCLFIILQTSVVSVSSSHYPRTITFHSLFIILQTSVVSLSSTRYLQAITIYSKCSNWWA